MKKSIWLKAIENSKNGKNLAAWDAIEYFVRLADNPVEFNVEYEGRTIWIKHLMSFEQPMLLGIAAKYPEHVIANVTHDLSSGCIKDISALISEMRIN